MAETTPRRLGTVKQAAALTDVSTQTVARWARQGLVSTVRVANGRTRYDLDDIEALIVERPSKARQETIAAAIAETVAAAPEFTDEQSERIRVLLHSGAGGPDDEG
jgi:DNA-binding transcriptional MerR regulator